MIFSVTTKDFKDALKAINLLKKTQIEGNDQLVLSAIDQHSLLIERFSVNVRFQAKLPVVFKELGNATVSFPQLLDVFKNPSGDIALFQCDDFEPSLGDKNKMSIEIDGDYFKVDSFNPEYTYLYPWLMKDEPPVGDMIRLSTIDLDALFKNTLPSCISPEDELGRPVFERIRLKTEGNDLIAYSCDSHRLTAVKSLCFADNAPLLDILIPFHIANVALKLFKKADDAFLWQTNSTVCLKIDNFTLSSKLFTSSDFPEPNKYIEQRNDLTPSALFNVNELKRAFNKLLPFAKKRRYKTVFCQFIDDSLSACVKDDDGNIIFKTAVPAADCSKTSIVFGINAVYMLDALKFLDNTVRLSFLGNKNPLVVEFNGRLFSATFLISLITI